MASGDHKVTEAEHRIAVAQIFKDLKLFKGNQHHQNIDMFLQTFQTFLDITGAENQLASSILMSKLEGEARDFAESLADDVKQDVTKLQKALLQEFHSHYYELEAEKRLDKISWKATETPLQLYTRLKPLVEIAHPSDPLMMRYELLKRLPRDLLHKTQGRIRFAYGITDESVVTAREFARIAAEVVYIFQED